MPKNHTQGSVHSQKHAHIFIRITARKQGAYQKYREDTLKAVSQQGNKACLPAKRPKRVGGSRVAASMLADIRTF